MVLADIVPCARRSSPHKGSRPAAKRGIRLICADAARPRSADGFLPDRDVLAALAGERLPAPPLPPVSQPQPPPPRHQVKLRRPHVPDRHLAAPSPAAG